MLSRRRTHHPLNLSTLHADQDRMDAAGNYSELIDRHGHLLSDECRIASGRPQRFVSGMAGCVGAASFLPSTSNATSPNRQVRQDSA